MSKASSISLTPHCTSILNRALANGRYKSADEVLTAALQLLDDEEIKIAALNNAIEEGMASGWVSDFDPEGYLRKIKEQK
jgi:antitoxin ParD1/3/4